MVRWCHTCVVSPSKFGHWLPSRILSSISWHYSNTHALVKRDEITVSPREVKDILTIWLVAWKLARIELMLKDRWLLFFWGGILSIFTCFMRKDLWKDLFFKLRETCGMADRLFEAHIQRIKISFLHLEEWPHIQVCFICSYRSCLTGFIPLVHNIPCLHLNVMLAECVCFVSPPRFGLVCSNQSHSHAGFMDKLQIWVSISAGWIMADQN